MLSNKDKKTLENVLMAPLGLPGLMEQKRSLDDLQRYTLHSNLSDMQPDTALLAIALVAHKIAPQLLISGLLSEECERIITSYAPLWLKNARSEALNHDHIIEILQDLTNDLDGLADLLHMALGEIEEGENTYEILNILNIQAGAQSLVAEQFSELLTPKKPRYDLEDLVMAEEGSNVVAFPGSFGTH